jgi:hypothetical protein
MDDPEHLITVDMTPDEVIAWDRLRKAELELDEAKAAVIVATNRAARQRRPRHLKIVSTRD